MGDIVYDNDCFGKTISCSKTPPSLKVSEEESFIFETRNLSYNSYTLVNLNHLSIDQLIVQRWLDVQQVVIGVQNQNQQRRFFEEESEYDEEDPDKEIVSDDEIIVDDI